MVPQNQIVLLTFPNITRMTTSKSSEAKKIMERTKDKVSIRADEIQ